MAFRHVLLAALAATMLHPVAAPRSSAAKQTGERPGFFRVEQRNGVWWLIAPNGKPFFSSGVDCVGRGAAREKYKPARPEFASFLFYPNNKAWARATLERLRAWGFNTLGAWGDFDTLKKESDLALPYTTGLWMGATAGVPWLDIFSKKTERIFDEIARKYVVPLKDDPNLIGWYTDNELGWWDETVFLYQLKQKPNATRRALVRLLRSHYHNDFTNLRRDFNTGKVRSFADLDRKGVLTLKPGGHGHTVIDEFTYLLARRYYQLAHDAIRRYDKNHLILGDRYIAWYPLFVARAIGPNVDVVSSNYQADWTDGSNARFHFDTLYRITGKPILVTEFYMCARENRSGNKNPGGGFPTVQTQKERTAGFAGNLRAYAELPYLVGAHWFQYYDEPTFGRPDGENFNMGLVDIHNKPYEELTTAATGLNRDLPAVHGASAASPLQKSSATGEAVIPPAPSDSESGLARWDKQRGFVESAEPFPTADLYACWDSRRLYLAVHMVDYIDSEIFAGRKIPESERPEWVIAAGQVKGPIRMRFGPGGPPHVRGAALSCRHWPNRTRYTALIALPASMFGKQAFQAGDTIPLNTTLIAHSRSRRMAWKTTLKLSDSR